MRNAPLGLTSKPEFKNRRPGATSRTLFPRRRTTYAACPAQKFSIEARGEVQNETSPQTISATGRGRCRPSRGSPPRSITHGNCLLQKIRVFRDFRVRVQHFYTNGDSNDRRTFDAMLR